MLACAFEDGLISSNPTAHLRMGPKALRAPRKDARAFTEDELRRVLDEIPPAYQLCVDVLADTGIRVSELLPLRKADIDTDERLIHITKSLVDGDRGAPKTKHSTRAVSFSPGLNARLRARLAETR